MDFDDTPEEAAFRAEVISFLEAQAPDESGEDRDQSPMSISDPEAERRWVDRCKAWQRTKYDHGWAGLTWPEEYGGRGLTGLQEGISVTADPAR